MKQYLLKVWMTAALSLLALGGVWGQAAPTVESLSPADDATEVSVGTTAFVLTFSEDVEFTDSGNARLFKDGNYLEGLELFSGNGNAVISGNTLTLTFVNSLAYSSDYYITIPNNSLRSVSGGVLFGGIAANEWSFTTEADASLPVTATLAPLDDTTDLPVTTTSFVLTFSEDVEFTDSGNARLFKDGNYLESLELFSGNGNAVISGNTLTLTFVNSLAYSSDYYITIPNNSLRSVSSGVLFGGIAVGDWSFTTEVEPEPLLMLYSSPEDGDVEVPRAPTLKVSFDQEITWGPSGVLTIHRSDNNDTVATISREQIGASISQYQLSIVFSSESLEYGK